MDPATSSSPLAATAAAEATEAASSSAHGRRRATSRKRAATLPTAYLALLVGSRVDVDLADGRTVSGVLDAVHDAHVALGACTTTRSDRAYSRGAWAEEDAELVFVRWRAIRAVRLPKAADEAARRALLVASKQRARGQRHWLAGDRRSELEQARRRMEETAPRGA